MADKVTRILFVGNSYTGRNDLPGMIRQIAASGPAPRAVETQAILASGMPLRAHWNRGEVVRALEEQAWDYVVLQEQSTLPLKNPARMRDSVLLLNEAIRKTGAQTLLYMTWSRQDSPERQDELSEVYLSIGREIGALVVPVGLAWKRSLVVNPAIILHEDDKSHPTLAGSYLAACVFYATLFADNPVGRWAPPSLAHGTVRVIQETAGPFAEDHPGNHS